MAQKCAGLVRFCYGMDGMVTSWLKSCGSKSRELAEFNTEPLAAGKHESDLSYLWRHGKHRGVHVAGRVRVS